MAAAAANGGGCEVRQGRGGRHGEGAPGGSAGGRRAGPSPSHTHTLTVAPSVDPHVGQPFPKPSQGSLTWLAPPLLGSLPPVSSQLLLSFTPPPRSSPPSLQLPAG